MWINRQNIFNRHHAQVPVVDTHNRDFWRIFYSRRVDGKSQPFYIDVEKGNPKNVLYESQIPILSLGKIGTFDVDGIMPTEIIQVDSRKYLYYIGWTNRKDVPYHNSIGLAISDDGGTTWEKFSKGPVFSTSYKEPGFVGTISVVYDGNIFHGYYLSCRDWKMFDGKIEPIYDIKYANSVNGIDWEPKGDCIPLDKNEGGLSKASIIKIDDIYYMWYSVRMEKDYREDTQMTYRIRCAQSNDLLNWKKITTLGLDVDNNSEWDNQMVEYPHVVEYKNILYLFYNGNGFGKTGIGYATFER
jgi:predicted GH43/DUF377 family glycosyl hydrolase